MPWVSSLQDDGRLGPAGEVAGATPGAAEPAQLLQLGGRHDHGDSPSVAGDDERVAALRGLRALREACPGFSGRYFDVRHEAGMTDDLPRSTRRRPTRQLIRHRE